MELDTGETLESGRRTLGRATRRIVPLPLQITKRVGKEYKYRKSPRSPDSETEESLGSAPEPQGGDKPIAIPKKRGRHCDLVFKEQMKENAEELSPDFEDVLRETGKLTSTRF